MTEVTVEKELNHPSPFISLYPVQGWQLVRELDLYIFPTHSDIVDQVREEIANPAFIKKTHGKRGTFFAGCSGPLCRKSQRDWARIARRRSAEKKGLPFKSRPRFSFLDEIDPLLEELYYLQLIRDSSSK